MQLKEDSLTCAYDKASFENYKKYISQNSNLMLYAAYVDIDNLKHICDTYSLPTADNCLIITAARLKKATDLLFRIGGDEFVLFIYKDEDLEILKYAKSRIPTLYFESGKSILSVSMGISDIGTASNINKLVKQAEERMKDNKPRNTKE